jgi:G3E family GTPase
MTKIDIFSGFLGAGKTTLIRKLIKEAYAGQKIVLIENEFGEIAIDGGFLKDAGVQITEMNSGCICCTLVGDFKAALEKVIDEYAPDRIVIEPSGVGKLSDVAKAVSTVAGKAELGAKVTVVDANKCKMYIRNFGEFFNDQVKNADVIVLSRTGDIDAKKLSTAVGLLQELNPDAVIITTPWDKLTGDQFTEAMEHRSTLALELARLAAEEDDDDDEVCECEDDDDDDDHDHDEHDDHDDMSMTSTTSTSIITTTITTTTSTMMTTAMRRATSTTTITITTTPTTCSPAGAARRPASSPRRS